MKELDRTYVANTYARFPVALVRGQGAEAWDEEGKRYIDFGSGIAVNTFGYADPVWQAAVTEQISRLQHTSNLYYTAPCAELAQQLCLRTGMKKVFFSNSGAEANECAIKVARRWAFNKYGDESHSTIVTLKNSFHGRTMATLAATGQDGFHTHYGPFPAGFTYVEANDSAALRHVLETVPCCAMLFEPVQGEGGVRALEKSFVADAAAMAKEFDLLLMLDEVQTGNGRTGTLYAFEQYGVQPDVVTTAKGLAAGLPLGATLFGERTADVLIPGSHGSTFGGNPVSCAAALSVIRRLDDAMLAGVRERAAYLRSELAAMKGAEEVTGLGLMVGIRTTRPAKEVASDCLRAGLMVLTAKDKLRLLPPLNIPMELLREGCAILKEALGK